MHCLTKELGYILYVRPQRICILQAEDCDEIEIHKITDRMARAIVFTGKE